MKSMCAFIDIKQMYDSVLHESLWDISCEYGIDNFLIAAIRTLCKNRLTSYCINDILSHWLHIDIGECQGGVIAPWLFNFYIGAEFLNNI